MRNLWCRWKNPGRRIYPSLFYQQHAPQSFFTCWSLSKRETDITSSNAYHHSAFIETEMTSYLDSWTTRTETQGYQYQGDKSTVEEVNKWKEWKLKQGKCSKNKLKLVGDTHIGFFECKKLLLLCVTLHLRLHRSSNDFSLQSLAESNSKFVILIERASVSVSNLILKDSVRLSIEKALINAPPHYPYFEMMNKSFIIQAGQNSFVKEIFLEQIPRDD